MEGVKTILVVEDDGDLRELITWMLVRAGYRVAEAADGVEALALLEGDSGFPDLVLLDLMMPRLSGIELLQRLRARSATKTLPVVVVSAIADRAVPPGAHAYLQKPVSRDELLEAVHEALQRGGVG